MNSRFLILVLIAASGLMFGKPALAQEDVKVKISTGFDFSTGDYGQVESTEIWYLPVTTKATFGDWTAKLTIPYLRIRGPGVVIGGGDSIVDDDDDDIVAGAAKPVTTESGLGDIIAALVYTIDLQDHDIFLDFTGKLKLPTADEDKGLGTGEADFTFQVDATKMFGSVYIFGGLGRKFVGSSAALPLDDIWLFNIGAGNQITKEFGFGASYDFRQSATSSADPSELTGYLTYKFTDSVSTMLYTVVGLSNGSPDAGVGLQLSYKFGSN